MNNTFLVGDKINLVNLFINNGSNNITLNIQNGLLKNTFFNNKDPLNISDNQKLDVNFAQIIITDIGCFPNGNCQYFGTVVKNSIDDDLIGSFVQGLKYSDLEVKSLNCFVWSVAHPDARFMEFVEYDTLKYLLSVKSFSNFEKGQSLIKFIDSMFINR